MGGLRWQPAAVNPATDAHHHELSTPATHNGMRSAATAAVNDSQCTVREELCVVVAATAASHRPTSMLREHLSARRSRCQQRHNAPSSHPGTVSVDSACTPTAASMCLGHSAPAGRRRQSAVRLHPATYLSAADHCGAQRSHRSARVATGHKSEGPVWRRGAPAPVHLAYQPRPDVARSPPSPTGAPPRTSFCFRRAARKPLP